MGKRQILLGLMGMAATLNCWAAPAFTAAGVTNAAGYQNHAVSPGEIVVIFGTGLGPAELVKLQVSGNRVTTTLAGVRVLFDGVPAPLVYVVGTQLSAIVPYSVTPGTNTVIRVEYQGELSAPVSVPVTTTVPALFTANASGTGQGAILNQDLTVNSPENPADVGSIVVFYATGEGQTNPAGQDGLVAGTVPGPIPAPTNPVIVEISNEPGAVEYAGGAPGLVAGAMQINARVPTKPFFIVERSALIRVGGVPSQSGVQVSVLSVPDPLRAGETIPLWGLTDHPRWRATIHNDELIPFEVRDGAGQVVMSGNLQDRVVVREINGKAVIAPQLRELNDRGTGARIVGLEKTGFAGVAVEVEYFDDFRTTPYQASRSADGDIVRFDYQSAVEFQERTGFPQIFLPSPDWEKGGTTRVTVRLPGGAMHSAEILNTARPRR